jgi:hypothetical protein
MCFRYGQRRGKGRRAEPAAPVESPVFDAALTAVPVTGNVKRNPTAMVVLQNQKAAEMEYRPMIELDGHGRVEMG